MATHLWFNGYDHSAGETAEDAERLCCELSGEEDCEGDGWVMVPDDAEMLDEACNPTGETAAQYAQQIVESGLPFNPKHPRCAECRPEHDGRRE